MSSLTGSQDFTLQLLEFTLKVFWILVHPSKCKGLTTNAQLIHYICYFDNFALLDNSHMFNCTERALMRIFQVLSKKKRLQLCVFIWYESIPIYRVNFNTITGSMCWSHQTIVTFLPQLGRGQFFKTWPLNLYLEKPKTCRHK